MGSVESRLNKAALKKAAAWGTEIDVNVAGSGIIPLNWGVPKHIMPGIDEDSIASPFEHDLDFGDVSPADFALEFDCRYDGLNFIQAAVMGAAAAPAKQGASDAYLHTLSLANSIAGIFGTYAVEKLDKIHVVPSIKFHKLTYSLAAGLLKLAVACRGNQVIDDSAIISAMTNVTYPQRHERTLYKQSIFRINAQSGIPLADGDKTYPRNFSVEIERRDIDVPHTASSPTIVEPLEGLKKPLVKVMLEWPRMDTANKVYFADWKAGNEKKMDLVFTGNLIAETYYYYIKFQFPRLKIEDIEYAHGGIIPAKAILRGLEADTAPQGMTGITKPVQLDLMNKSTANALA